jgi:Mn-containing catalase
MHQNQWLAAIEELKADGLEETPVPSNFPQEQEFSEVAYRFMNFSEGQESAQGRWASGPSEDGKGEIEYVANPQAMGPQMDELDPLSSRACTQPLSSRCLQRHHKVTEQGDTVRAGASASTLQASDPNLVNFAEP